MVAAPIGIDDKEFFSRMANEDALGVVILGMIYIDYELITLIEEVVVEPAAVKRMDLDFSNRVLLAVALGLDDRFAPALRAFATLRNKFAHRPDAVIGKLEADNLYKALSGTEKEVVRNSYKRTSERVQLAADFAQAFNALDSLDLVRLIIVSLRQALRAGRMQAAKGDW